MITGPRAERLVDPKPLTRVNDDTRYPEKGHIPLIIHASGQKAGLLLDCRTWGPASGSLSFQRCRSSFQGVFAWSDAEGLEVDVRKSFWATHSLH